MPGLHGVFCANEVMLKPMFTCSGGCHCGRVKFKIEVPDNIIVQRCNCSICQKSGYLHLILEASRFELIRGEDSLTDYRFHTGVARHLFCKVCGIKSFYIPRSHPDSFSINLNCVELPDEIDVVIQAFDGGNWSRNRDSISTGTTD